MQSMHDAPNDNNTIKGEMPPVEQEKNKSDKVNVEAPQKVTEKREDPIGSLGSKQESSKTDSPSESPPADSPDTLSWVQEKESRTETENDEARRNEEEGMMVEAEAESAKDEAAFSVLFSGEKGHSESPRTTAKKIH